MKRNISLSSENINLEKELKTLIRNIVRSELKNIKPEEGSSGLSSKKTKPVETKKSASNINSLKKAELIALSKKNKLTVNSTDTKAEILKKLKENKVKVI